MKKSQNLLAGGDINEKKNSESRIVLKPLKLFAAMARNDDGSYHIVGLMHPNLGHMPVVNSKREVVEMCFNMIEQTIRAKSKIVEFTSNEDFNVEKD